MGRGRKERVGGGRKEVRRGLIGTSLTFTCRNKSTELTEGLKKPLDIR